MNVDKPRRGSHAVGRPLPQLAYLRDGWIPPELAARCRPVAVTGSEPSARLLCPLGWASRVAPSAHVPRPRPARCLGHLTVRGLLLDFAAGATRLTQPATVSARNGEEQITVVAKAGWGWLWRAWEAPRSAGPAAPARSAVQPLTRRRCLSGVSAANAASSAAGPRDRWTEPGHKQSSGLFVPGEGPGHWPGPQGSLSEAKAAEDKRHSQPQPAFAGGQSRQETNDSNAPSAVFS